MTPGGSISVQTVRGYLELARAQGLDVKAVLNEAGSAELLDDFDGRVPWQICEKIALAIVGRIGIVGMVRTMLKLRGAGFSVLYYVARHSDTVGIALRRVVEHYRLTSTLGTCELVEQADTASLALRQHDYLSVQFKGLVSVLWAVSNATVLKQLVNMRVRPIAVGIQIARPSDPSELSSYSQALDCPLLFGTALSSITIDRAVLSEKVAGADPVLEAAMMRYVAELAATLPDEGVAGKLRRMLLESLRGGEPTMRDIARRLGTTARTLQRRLREEKTSFQQVLDEVRREVALSQIRARRASIDEVAFLLGFEKPSSFHRAFKRWTGVTPGEFRRQAATS